MKKIVIVVIMFMMVLCFVSCEQIEDTNGEDNTDLCELTLDDITGIKHSFSSVKTATTTKSELKCGIGHNKVFGIHEDVDVDYLRFKGGPSSGTKVLIATKLASEQSITFNITSNIESGNMQLFLVSPSNEIIYEFDDTTQNYEFIAEEEGVYLIILGAESFVGNIEIDRNFELDAC